MVPVEPPNDAADLYDGPWKLGLDGFLPHMMLLLFPASHAEIDWSRSYRPLNAELQGIRPADDKPGRRFADALYEVWRQDGREQWIILHFEVQSQPDHGLPERMYVYSYRCFERYKREVFGYAILGDRSPSFRPGPYVWELGKARMVYQYEVAKLLDFKVADLEASDNPAALILLAHHYTADTKSEQTRRRRFKVHLTRLLFGKGYTTEEAGQLFKVLDWMLRLGPEQAIIFTQEVISLREDPTMSAYVNTFETYFTQLGIEKGKQLGLSEGKQLGLSEGKQLGLHEGKQLGLHEGLQEGVHRGAERVLRSQLTRRFGELPAWVGTRLAEASTETLECWSLRLLDASSLDDVFA